MLSRTIAFCIVTMLPVFHHAYADLPRPVTAIMNPGAFEMLNQTRESIEAEMQACETDDSAVVTIYSATGKAQVGIDVKLDGRPVGSLTSHFPGAGPACKTPSSAGVITLIIPGGVHVLDAESLNLVWPSHRFSINKCECLLLPLSD